MYIDFWEAENVQLVPLRDQTTSVETDLIAKSDSPS